MRKSLWKSMSPAKKLQHITGAKNLKLDTLKEIKRNSSTLPMSPLPQGSISVPRQPFSAYGFSCGAK